MAATDVPGYTSDDWDPRSYEYWLRELTSEDRELGVKRTPVEDAKRRRQATWLATYARTGAKSTANGFAQITRMTLSRWKEDPIFQPLISAAEEALADICTAEIVRRAVEGVNVSVRDKHGNVIGEERKWDTPLLIHLSKMGRDPEKRWAKAEQAIPQETWRQVFNQIQTNPDLLAALDIIADATVAKPKG